MARVELRNLRKSFGSFEAIRGVDLTIEEGSFVVFVGPSGCGKSTLLRLIAGLEEPTGGTILIDDEDVTDLSPAERSLAMVFQSYALYPHMSVRDNMAFGLRLAGVDRASQDRKIQEAAQTLKLDALLHRRPRELSGGQRQRVAIGRAIVREPQVFLFDEPLSNLDAALRVQMRTEIARLHHRLGATMIFVTHDQTEAMTMADRIVVLRAGIIEQVGAPLDRYERPANLFVAGFLGSPKMNLLPGRVAAVEGGEALVETASGARIPAAVRPGATSPGDAVTLGLRPEMFELSPDGPFEGRVELVEQLGHVQLVYASLPDGTPLVAELRDRRPPKVDSAVRLGLGRGIRHVFDAKGFSITRHEEGAAA